MVIDKFVRPSIGRLVNDGLIDSFFFIRYILGGPHIRLRVHPCKGCSAETAQRLTADAKEFLDIYSSVQPLDQDLIRRQNQALLAESPEESDDTIYADNTFHEFPFIPETERYGGGNLIESSLDFFALSSYQAFHFIAVYLAEPRPRQLTAIMRLLFRQAFGMAHREEELNLLLASRASFTLPGDPLLSRADDAFERQPDIYRSLLKREIETVANDQHFCWFVEASRRLSNELRSANDVLRRSIGLSQMHMTANRLGLRNQEEVYLGRILWRAAADLASSEPFLWEKACTQLVGHGGGRLRNLFHVAWEEVFSSVPLGREE